VPEQQYSVPSSGPVRQSVPVEQHSLPISAPVRQSVPVEQQSVPISVPVERQSVPEEFVAHMAHAQSVTKEQQRVAEQQWLAVSAHPLEPSGALNTSFCEPRKPDQQHV